MSSRDEYGVCGVYVPPREGHGRWGCEVCGFSADMHDAVPQGEPQEFEKLLDELVYAAVDLVGAQDSEPDADIIGAAQRRNIARSAVLSYVGRSDEMRLHWADQFMRAMKELKTADDRIAELEAQVAELEAGTSSGEVENLRFENETLKRHLTNSHHTNGALADALAREAKLIEVIRGLQRNNTITGG